MKPHHAAVALAAVLAGCGGSAKPAPEAQVRATLRTFATAVEQRQYGRLCNQVFAPKLLQGLQEVGLPCEVAMRTSLGEVRDPKLRVSKVFVKGTNAEAQVETTATGQAPSTDTVRLTKLKQGWRVSALGGGATSTSSPTPTPTATATSSPAP